MSISDVLAAQGRTQRWLARQLDIHESLLSKYLRGSRPMPVSVVRDVARILGVPASSLFSVALELPVGTEIVSHDTAVPA